MCKWAVYVCFCEHACVCTLVLNNTIQTYMHVHGSPR